jgi:hypothetical protein
MQLRSWLSRLVVCVALAVAGLTMLFCIKVIPLPDPAGDDLAAAYLRMRSLSRALANHRVSSDTRENRDNAEDTYSAIVSRLSSDGLWTDLSEGKQQLAILADDLRSGEIALTPRSAIITGAGRPPVVVAATSHQEVTLLILSDASVQTVARSESHTSWLGAGRTSDGFYALSQAIAKEYNGDVHIPLNRTEVSVAGMRRELLWEGGSASYRYDQRGHLVGRIVRATTGDDDMVAVTTDSAGRIIQVTRETH